MKTNKKEDIIMSNRVDNLVQMLDTYVDDGGYHLNVNVFNRET